MKCLIIQTAFLGDVILATPVVETIRAQYPKAIIDILVRKGNETLLTNHPHLHQVLILEKRQQKYLNLWKMLRRIQSERYDKVINLHRFASSGFLTVFSKAKEKIGFDKNPLSRLFDRRIAHRISIVDEGQHEVERNLSLVSHFTDKSLIRPRLYPSKDDYAHVKSTIVDLGAANKKHVTIAPASVWFTKQLPEAKWIELVQKLPTNLYVYLIGAPADRDLCERIRLAGNSAKVINWAGKFSLLQSAALMENAEMNYVNDSAPLHLASAMNAPVTAFFCSTVPAFGFTPLSDQFKIMESHENLSCRPCGLHGKKSCPKGHFKCSQITLDYIIN